MNGLAAFGPKAALLYMMIAIGFLAGRRLHLNREVVSKLLFYVLTPIVVFGGVLDVDLTPSTALLPVLIYVLSSSMALLTYRGCRILWDDGRANIVGYSAGTANSGYFGLPIAVALFDEATAGLYLMGLLGQSVYENTLGFYLTARGASSEGATAGKALKRVLRLPTIYAMVLALTLNINGYSAPAAFQPIENVARLLYSTLGMMIIGIALAPMRRLEFDRAFTGAAFAVRWIAWPLLVTAVIAIDVTFLHYGTLAGYRVLQLIAIVPLAANTVVLASIMRVHPEKAATTVLLSTVLSLVYLPLMITFFIK